jgi:hypothetical protein
VLRIAGAIGSLRDIRSCEQARGERQPRAGARDVPNPFHVDLPVKVIASAKPAHSPAAQTQP